MCKTTLIYIVLQVEDTYNGGRESHKKITRRYNGSSLDNPVPDTFASLLYLRRRGGCRLVCVNGGGYRRLTHSSLGFFFHVSLFVARSLNLRLMACVVSPSSLEVIQRGAWVTAIFTSYIPSRLDYCNYIVIGTPNSAIWPHQKILNFAATLVLLAPRQHHSTLLLEKLHWLLIWKCIHYKVACMCFNAINASGPAYLSELIHVYTQSRTLRSSSHSRMLKIKQYKRKTLWTPHLEFTTTRP